MMTRQNDGTTTGGDRPRTLWRRLVASPLPWAMLVSAITLLVFVNVLGNEFVMWDDDVNIYMNPNLGGLSAERLRWIFTDVDSNMRYMPVTLLTWAATYDVWELDPFGYHFGNWALHGLSAALVFAVTRQLLRLRAPAGPDRDTAINAAAAVAAMLWSLHPMRVEPVAWATDRPYCLAVLFVLLSTWFYLAAGRRERLGVRGVLLLAASTACFMGSLLSHPIGIGFIAVLFILDVYPLGAGRPWWRVLLSRRSILSKIPCVAAAAAVAVITMQVRIASAGIWDKPVTLEEFGVAERAAQAVYILAHYGWRPLLPIDLSPVYTTLVTVEPLAWRFIASGAGLAGVLLALFLLRRRWPLGLATALSILALLAPTTGIFEHPHFPSDRYALIASIPLSVLVAAGLAHPALRGPMRGAALVLAAVALTTLATLTVQQTLVWRSSITLFTHIVETLGDDPYREDIYWRLGLAYAKEGDMDRAAAEFRRSLELVPHHRLAGFYLGRLLEQTGRREEAIEHYRRLARVQIDAEQSASAIESLARIVKLRPDSSAARDDLAMVLLQTGQLDTAIDQLEAALRLEPSNEEVRRHLERARTLRWGG